MEFRKENSFKVLINVTGEDLSSLLPELKISLKKNQVIPKCIFERGSNGEIVEACIPISIL